MSIPDHLIADIKSTLDIVEVVGGYVTLKRGGSNHAGLCPFHAEKTPSFSVSASRQSFHCFGCGEGGDVIEFLQKIEGLTFPEAVRLAADRAGIRIDHAPRPKTQAHPLQAPPVASQPDWSPAAPVDPAALWREKAGAFVIWSHEQLLASADQRAYLSSRGIPEGAVAHFGLGWNPGENGRDAIFRERSAWGLPPKVVDGKSKKLWIPRGIVMPTWRDDQLQSVWIRRPQEDRTRIGIPYLPLDGSGNDVAVFGAHERAFVIVESTLCAIAVAWACRGIAGAIPLNSASVKPKSHANSRLRDSLCILVATDFEFKYDERKQRDVSAGGQAARWWREHYPQAERWPVPAGKDPGDYVKDHAGDLRDWVLAGLRKFCPALAVMGRKSDAPRRADPPAPPAKKPGLVRAVSRTGRPYILVQTWRDARQAAQIHPGEPVFFPSEVARMKGKTQEEIEQVFDVKEAFEGGRVLA